MSNEILNLLIEFRVRAVRILIENVLHPPILKAGICWQAQNAGKPHHLWQK